jgi:hypothetical protein
MSKMKMDRMNKREMIRIHFALAQVKLFLEEQMDILGIADELDFREYDELNISPVHIHRSRREHRKAILTLSSEIIAAVSKYRAHASKSWQMVRA